MGLMRMRVDLCLVHAARQRVSGSSETRAESNTRVCVWSRGIATRVAYSGSSYGAARTILKPFPKTPAQ
jgi:hypothetical protein